MIHPLEIPRAAAWTVRAGRAARGVSWSDLPGLSLPPVPAGSDVSRRTVWAVLWLRRARCLESSLVVQAWEAAHGRPRDVVIGVTAPDDDFSAHAWLDGDERPEHDFRELVRHPPAA